MASPYDAVQEYNFVEKLSNEFICPVTLSLLREPHQTLCCGNHLLQDAVTELQQHGESACPLCKQTLRTMPDMFFKRKVNELKVHCLNKSLGCEWVGELGSLDKHLSLNSMKGECQFTTVDCPHSCGDEFQRHQLDEHTMNDCPNRPFTCQYCGHEATYVEVTNEHWPVCERYPVECSNNSLGCQWAGERGVLDQHLSRDLEEGECKFVTVACPYACGDGFQRCQLEGHKVNDCPNRAFTCNYCSYEATYNEVTSEHWPICKKFILQCPNKCGEDAIERQHLRKHLHETCPQQVIKCEFRHAGCRFKGRRRHMQAHSDEDVKVHLALVSRENERQQQTIDEQQRQIDLLSFKTEQLQECVRQQDIHFEQSLSTSRQQLESLRSELHSGISTLNQAVRPAFFPSSPNLEMTDFAKHKRRDKTWFSPTFYSHFGGYNMYLVVDANGMGAGQGTHVSVWIHLTHGDFDRHLKWPFRGDITVQLLNQRSDEGHWEKTVYAKDTTDPEAVCKEMWWNITTRGTGFSDFIPHAELNTEDKEYLRNDCLKFRISKIVGMDV